MDWACFKKLVRAEKTPGGPAQRLKVLARARHLLSQGKPFAQLPELDRRCLAGIQKPSLQPDGLDWGFFGQMSAHGNFSPILHNHVAKFSKALDHIQLVGTVREKHYDAYRDTLMSIPDAGDWIGMGTRLLAMKRPDRFVCVNNANRTGLCGYFGVPPPTTNLHNYWERIVVPMQVMPWWRAEMPSDASGRRCGWAARPCWTPFTTIRPSATVDAPGARRRGVGGAGRILKDRRVVLGPTRDINMLVPIDKHCVAIALILERVAEESATAFYGGVLAGSASNQHGGQPHRS